MKLGWHFACAFLFLFAEAGLAATYTFDVSKYGASPSNPDSAPAISAALADAMKTITSPNDNAVVFIPSGTYRLKCSNSGQRVCFELPNARNLQFKGAGKYQTALIVENPAATFFRALNSNSITVSDFSLDYSTVPFTQGRVDRFDPASNSVELSIEPGFPSLDHPQFSREIIENSFFSLFEASQPTLKGSAGNAYILRYDNITQISPGRFRLKFDIQGNTTGITAGDRMALGTRKEYGFAFERNENVFLQNVTIYTAPGIAVMGWGNQGSLSINGLEIRRKPGTSRLLSAAADAIHLANNSRRLVIQNSYIEGMGDDAINTRSTGFSVLNILGPNKIQMETGAFRIQAGDRLQFVNRDTEVLKATAKILSVTPLDAWRAEVTLDRSISVTTQDVIFNVELASPRAHIINNTFSNFRGIFRIRSQDAIFAGNKILDPRNAGMHVGADIDPKWTEGPTVSQPLGVYFFGNQISGGSIDLMKEKYTPFSHPSTQDDRYAYLHPAVFDLEFYRYLYSDLSLFSDEYLKYHWMNHGLREGRQAQLYFNSGEYLALYVDLRNAFGWNPEAALIHYLKHGGTLEGRQGSMRTSPLVFNAATYRGCNYDLAFMDDRTIGIHWLLHGINEGRQATLGFHSARYLQLYPDLHSAFGPTGFDAALIHYIRHGIYEGRRGL